MDRRGGWIAVVAGFAAAAWPGVAPADGALPPCHSAPPAAATAAPEEPGTEVQVSWVDAPLVDRDGRPVRLAEVAGDRIVVMDFIFTSCTTVCPVLSGLFSSLQERLADKLGTSVRLVSISIDPNRDSPTRMAAMAARHHAGTGWSWLTGEPQQVERVLRGLGTYAARPADHSPAVLVGDPRRGRWYRLNGFPSPETIAARVDALLAARAAGGEGR